MRFHHPCKWVVLFLGLMLIQPPATAIDLGFTRLEEAVFFIAVDVTTSVEESHFTSYQRVIVEDILPLLRSGDVVYILEIDSDPRRDPVPRRFALKGTLREIPERVKEMAACVRSIRQKPRSYRGTTNIGGVLAFMKEIAELREDRLADPEGDAQRQPCHYVTILLTDGRRDGQQSDYVYDQLTALHASVYFLGLEEPAHDLEHELGSFTKAAGFQRESVHFVGYRALAEIGERLALTLNRTWNPAIRKALGLS